MHSLDEYHGTTKDMEVRQRQNMGPKTAFECVLQCFEAVVQGGKVRWDLFEIRKGFLKSDS